jgi:hypothetical protein
LIYEYIAYGIVIALAVKFSYSAGAKAGLEFGVNYCLDNLHELNIIDFKVDKDGNEIVVRVVKNGKNNKS